MNCEIEGHVANARVKVHPATRTATVTIRKDIIGAVSSRRSLIRGLTENALEECTRARRTVHWLTRHAVGVMEATSVESMPPPVTRRSDPLALVSTLCWLL